MKSAGNTIRLAISIALILNGLFSLDRSSGATSTPHQLRSPFISSNTRTTPVTDERSRARVREAYGKLPLRFEANAGQTDSQVKFLSHGSGYIFFLTSAEAVLALSNRGSKADAESKSLIRIKFSGANPVPQLGGSSFEEAGDLKVDAQGGAYITGYTRWTDFPTVNAIQSVAIMVMGMAAGAASCHWVLKQESCPSVQV
jgi:hypothetical protein